MKISHNIFIKHHILFFIILFLSMSVACRIFGTGADYANYLNIFSSKIINIEPFFYLLRIINLYLFHGNLFFVYLFTCLFSLIIKFNFFIKYAHNKYLTLLFYICTFFFIHEYTQIRASVAIGIFFISIKDIIEHRPKNFLIKTIIACMFHYSSIIMIIIYIYCNYTNRKRIYIVLPWLFFLIDIVISFYFNYLENINNIFDIILNKNTREYSQIFQFINFQMTKNTIGVKLSAFNKVYLTLLCICTFIYYIYNGFNDKKYIIDFYFFKILTFSVFSYFCLIYFLGNVLVVRVSEFTFPIISIVLTNAIIRIKERYFFLSFIFVFMVLIFYRYFIVIV